MPKHALPFCHASLSCVKPGDYDYPSQLISWGDHIRKKRLDEGLYQKDVAKIIGVNVLTVTNWEKNHVEPEIRYIPKIIEFLGYNPLHKPKSFSEQLYICRQNIGLSQEKFAIIIGVDPATVHSWEKGEHLPTKQSLAKLSKWLKQFKD